MYKKGDLVLVKVPYENNLSDLCIITSITIPCVIKLNEFFMVYSIRKKEKFVTTINFMKKIN